MHLTPTITRDILLINQGEKKKADTHMATEAATPDL